MSISMHLKEVDSVIPGLSSAYGSLRSPDYVGIYTSNGELFNHTFFGRDAGMTAKFVCDFDHEVALETIYMLAAYQGTGFDKVTGEEPGKIHHEFRDFTTWQGSLFNKIGFYVLRSVWGGNNRRMLTYFADDTTATYIRLVHKYATRIDKSVLGGAFKDKEGRYSSISESVERAANWIVGNLSEDGLFSVQRTNRWSLPFQIFQDSVTGYTWSDGKVANFNQPISYIEAHAYALDALQDAYHLLPTSRHNEMWRKSIEKMTKVLLNDFWDQDKQFFASCISRRDNVMKPLDVPNISAGFTLNNLFWKDVPASDRSQKITSVVERLFSDEFLTDFGLRTKSKYYQNSSKKHIEYHDHQTIWTMFNFMVIEGLRKHRLYRLAEQLERRLLRAARLIDGFQEFYIVDSDGTLYQPDNSARKSLSSQMAPERNIAFTVVPAMVMARRFVDDQIELEPADWQTNLENKILNRIQTLSTDDVNQVTAQTNIIPVKIKRTRAGFGAAKSVIFKRVRK